MGVIVTLPSLLRASRKNALVSCLFVSKHRRLNSGPRRKSMSRIPLSAGRKIAYDSMAKL